MIRYKVKIEYRDETKKKFDCYESPTLLDKFLVLFTTQTKRKYVPLEAIHSYEVEDYWRNDNTE